MESFEYAFNSCGIPLLCRWRRFPTVTLTAIRIGTKPTGDGNAVDRKQLPGEAEKLVDQIDALLRGELAMQSLTGFDLAHLTGFQRKILLTLHDQVPRGRIVSYGRLAELAGDPGAARAVGGAMNRNPFPIVIPCHRVIAADGGLGGFGPGTAWKIKLLELEGLAPETLAERLKKQ